MILTNSQMSCYLSYMFVLDEMNACAYHNVYRFNKVTEMMQGGKWQLDWD
jgi:hypothetical protein